jgi:hypothetical protein
MLPKTRDTNRRTSQSRKKDKKPIHSLAVFDRKLVKTFSSYLLRFYGSPEKLNNSRDVFFILLIKAALGNYILRTRLPNKSRTMLLFVVCDWNWRWTENRYGQKGDKLHFGIDGLK